MMTATDWQAAGAAMPEAGRRTMREQLEAAGLKLDTAVYNAAVAEFRRGQEAALAERRAAAEARERQRVEPFLASARENVMAWGCVEAGSTSAEEVEAMVADEARLMADEADERAAAEAALAEREAEQLADYLARQDGLRAAVTAAEAAVAGVGGWRMRWRQCGNSSSRYYWLLRGGDPADDGDWEERHSLRISDHHAPHGSGWNEAAQDRHAEPDINIVLRRGAGGVYTFDLTPLVETLGQ